MKTITKILLLVVLISTLTTNGQNDYFNPDDFLEIKNSSNYSASTTYDFDNSQPKVFNVNFYFLDLTTGGGFPSTYFNEDYALKNIAALNIAFNQFNIFFKYRGNQVYSQIYNGSELTNQSDNRIINRMYEVAQNQGTDNNINIVYSHTNCQPVLGSANIYKKVVSLWYCHSAQNYLIYQMGHLLGLLKTHQDTYGQNSGIYTDENYCNPNNFNSTELKAPDFSNNILQPENVTRDINNPNYNANIAGDMVVDTPACFKGSEDNYCHYDGTGSEATYEYIPHSSIVDNSLEHLLYENVDVLNFMSYHYAHAGLRHFTDGQGIRMRETIAIPSLNFDDVSTDIASLYEPYKNTYYGAGPTLPNHRPLFQPGFDYYFVPCSGDYNSPADYNDVSFNFSINNLCNDCIINKESLDLNNITHHNHTAIFISQLNINDLKHGGQPRKCYNNNNRMANSGTVIKFVDNIPNENVIIDPKDEQEINDENLIQNLDNGLYIIKKNYEDGTQEQKTIYKNGN